MSVRRGPRGRRRCREWRLWSARSLKPLRVTSATLVLRHPIHVRPDSRVLFDGYSYSMPPNAIGQSGTLYLGANAVRIVAGRWEATHPRLRGDRRESVLPEHRAAI